MTEWYGNTWNGSYTNAVYYPTVTTGSSTSVGTSYMPTVFTMGAAPLPVKELTALEWLDAEIERTCALAR